ncbi:substrate-binding periplasmic protein [Thalassolituus sp. LLYu03]|uniref:substrate-binding periplasmic protein n=1 Tax=Thalassolituus sp. LLYu03 TaxID=3421656 RepID=UPI003D2D7CAF
MTHANDREIVRVGAYLYPPYVEQDASGHLTGITPKVLNLLNQNQEQYQFVLVPISPKRRYQTFEQADYDMIFFENPAWGWDGIAFQQSRPRENDGEVFVALAKAERDQSYFATLKGKRMIGILGFHYGFAGFNADEEYLRREFNMILSWTNENNLQLLKDRSGEIAIMSLSFLYRYFRDHPDERHFFLVSDTFDQLYRHSVLIRPGFTPDAAAMDALLDDLRAKQLLQPIFHDFGIYDCPVPPADGQLPRAAKNCDGKSQ